MTSINSGDARVRTIRGFRAGYWGQWALILGLCLLAGLRAALIGLNYGPFAGCTNCMLFASFSADCWLLAAGFLLMVPACLGRGWIRVICTLPVLILMLLMALDVALLATLNSRMYLFDLLKFGGEWSATRDVVGAVLKSRVAIPAMFASVWLAVCFLALIPDKSRPGRRRGLLLASAVSLAMALTGGLFAPQYVHADGYRNLVWLQWNDGSNRGYSSEYLKQQHSVPPLPEVCVDGQSQHPDVILLIVESLSAYHSQLLGADRNETPELDALARRHRYFTGFHANAFTTDMGLIALLAGELPVPSRGRRSSLDAFAGFGGRQHSVPVSLDRGGYESAFFTSGDLGFLNKRPWLRGLGFDYIEGNESSYYDGKPRFAFGAARDVELYGSFLQWMKQRSSKAPLFSALLTVQSHPPYVDRETGTFDESGIIKAVDRSAATFAQELEATGYFRDGGILLITGDHRAMTALNPDEAQWGEHAFARVPLIAVGPSHWPDGPVSGLFQQTDLLASLEQLTESRTCSNSGAGYFLQDQPQAADWVLHVRGDQRDRIDYYAANGDAWLKLDGDDSHWSGQVPKDAEAIAARIHEARARRGELKNDLPGIFEMLAH